MHLSSATQCQRRSSCRGRARASWRDAAVSGAMASRSTDRCGGAPAVSGDSDGGSAEVLTAGDVADADDPVSLLSGDPAGGLLLESLEEDRDRGRGCRGICGGRVPAPAADGGSGCKATHRVMAARGCRGTPTRGAGMRRHSDTHPGVRVAALRYAWGWRW